MTLDEAIRYVQKVADYDCYNESQRKRAEEHKQLAKFLMDYKELKQSNIETIEAMKIIKRQYEDATALLEVALCDIERLLNCNSPTECRDLARFRNVSFMNGIIELPNVWRYADEARELIDKGTVNNKYNYCQICGRPISSYKQVCHACETKYEIRLGDSIMGKVYEYVKKLEGDSERLKEAEDDHKNI